MGLERSDADDQAAKSYGILLSDTVVVMPDGAPPEVATASTPKDWSEVAYYLDQVGSWCCHISCSDVCVCLHVCIC